MSFALLMSCYLCGSSDCDPDIGMCFECYVTGAPLDDEPILDECAARGHEPYNPNTPTSMFCWCGQHFHIREAIGV